MTKKTFAGGINSLIGDQTESKVTYKGAKKFLDEMLKDEPKTAKRGRPKTQFKEITKSSQEGTKINETRATFIVNEELLDKLKAVAYWDRLLIKDVINTAFAEAVAKYEKKNGVIQLPKK